MVYNEFTLGKVKSAFGISTREGDRFLPQIEPISPSSNLQESLNENLPVSIQLVSPASGDMSAHRTVVSEMLRGVSIQLVSPASGDSSPSHWNPKLNEGFHSISFSSEWRPSWVQHQGALLQVSIQLVSPASGD